MHCKFLKILTLSVLVFSGCRMKKDGEAVRHMQGKGIPVTVASVVQKVVPIQLRTIGTVEPYATVGIKSQITAELMQVHFQEGQHVKRGDSLFTLDKKPCEATIKQVKANLARETIQMQQIQKELQRKRDLFDRRIISFDEYDKLSSSAQSLEAAVRADTAALEYAELQLSYCTISSPLDGRTGSLLIHPGNLLKANDAILVHINQIKPIYVTFSIPEQELASFQKYSAEKKPEVLAFIPPDTERPETGVYSFMENTVDRNTGTIRIKATFENKEERLWPGQFVNVVLILSYQRDAIVVPSQAIQTGQIGSYVFVVKSDLTVDAIPVVAVRDIEGETVIGKELQPETVVVTDGQLRLTKGSKVEIKEEGKSDKEGKKKAISGKDAKDAKDAKDDTRSGESSKEKKS